MKKKGMIIALSSVVGAVVLCVLLNIITDGALSSTAVSTLAHINIISLAEKVYISEDEIELTPTDKPYQLVAAVYPENAVGKKITWKSDNPGVATVDENGVVTPRGSGEAYITAICGDVKAGCNVTVFQPVEKLSLNQIMMRVRQGTEVQLTATIEPDNATVKTLHWASTDETVAIVDNDGNILVTGPGSADIVVASQSGATASCRILAVEPEPSPTPIPDPTARPGRTVPPSTPDPEEEKIELVSPHDILMEYPYTLEDLIAVQMQYSPKVYRSSVYSDATAEEIRRYIDPELTYGNEYMKYQFVDLSRSAGADEDIMDAYLSDKGILSDTAAAFIGAGEQYGVSELYLVAHACLETGNGTSTLARGVTYNGTTVYNMFGIGAYDGDAVNGGAKYAYEHGWTTVEKAIYGGAEFISKNYINGEYRQNTLYKMLWNPNAPGKHQYATDIGWAVKQAQTLKRFYEGFGIEARFEVPSYEQ